MWRKPVLMRAHLTSCTSAMEAEDGTKVGASPACHTHFACVAYNFLYSRVLYVYKSIRMQHMYLCIYYTKEHACRMFRTHLGCICSKKLAFLYAQAFLQDLKLLGQSADLYRALKL